MLLPSQEYLPEQYIPFKIAIGISFLLKLISTAIMVYKQSSCHIYFLDWEPPRKYESKEEDKVWRTLFVANEFNELSVLRTISVEWSLFFLGLFMSGFEWENTAAQQPTIHRELNTDSVKINIVLKLFIGCGIFYVIGLAQIILRQLIKIWFPYNIQDFTDFCSVANISIFIFDDYLHGYYVHGQSPDKYAEGNALWLMQCLGDDIGHGDFLTNIFGQNALQQQQQMMNNSLLNRIA
ncbi:meckel syndrome type 3 protein mekelin, putative [Ichthyophthirius multifiliis]|uniref:Meckel syndrome type 3 protein mekelin, putative n=1 Tax=Ichthyophthirius multifiliis TaxID=5932 RepID=G0QMV1_ICHMU|nr:meckel syndrome type 3 protein mekelin, putative [Ichthyophthirius multifiliis]EGR33461.1 meckel syndrome type 3 protein mekelin, putative [Ichthyophthirius multifiliis]|eukprot:XP_004037447.1 meckel syndrome type 3 protein mekelin, putative [Ichthyophthirius multifiliis]